MLDGYPRTCRNGHLINGPEDEHPGHHRQCRKCLGGGHRSRRMPASTRTRRAPGTGLLTVSAFRAEPLPPRPEAELEAQRPVVAAKLAAVRAEIEELTQALRG